MSAGRSDMPAAAARLRDQIATELRESQDQRMGRISSIPEVFDRLTESGLFETPPGATTTAATAVTGDGAPTTSPNADGRRRHTRWWPVVLGTLLVATALLTWLR